MSEQFYYVKAFHGGYWQRLHSYEPTFESARRTVELLMGFEFNQILAIFDMVDDKEVWRWERARTLRLEET